MTFTAKQMKSLWLRTGKILLPQGSLDSFSEFYSQLIYVPRASHFKWSYLSKGVLLLAGICLVLAGCGDPSYQPKNVAVTIPGSDYFSPAILTIHVGDTVKWTNQDTDNHTVTSAPSTTGTTISDDFDRLILGTNENHGQAGTFSHTFKTTGTLVYYCKLHAKLDSATHQFVPKMAMDPSLPAMMGTITILP